MGDPLIDGESRVYLLTVDGYLHAFEADGRYRFSYTVSGTPLGSPSLRRSDGAILLGTTSRLVYAINQRGGLAMKATTVVPVWSGLYPLDDQSVTYLGLDRRVYALSNFGGALYRVRLPGPPTGEPVIGDDGLVWVPIDRGLARLHRALSLRLVALPQAVDEVLALGRGALVLAGSRAYWVDGAEEVHDLGPSVALLRGERQAARLSPEGKLSLIDVRGVERSLPLAGSTRGLLARGVSGPGVLGGDSAYVALREGGVLRIDLQHPERAPERLEVGTDSVTRLVAQGNKLAAVARSGLVCVRDL